MPYPHQSFQAATAYLLRRRLSHTPHRFLMFEADVSYSGNYKGVKAANVTGQFPRFAHKIEYHTIKMPGSL